MIRVDAETVLVGDRLVPFPLPVVEPDPEGEQ